MASVLGRLIRVFLGIFSVCAGTAFISANDYTFGLTYLSVAVTSFSFVRRRALFFAYVVSGMTLLLVWDRVTIGWVFSCFLFGSLLLAWSLSFLSAKNLQILRLLTGSVAVGAFFLMALPSNLNDNLTNVGILRQGKWASQFDLKREPNIAGQYSYSIFSNLTDAQPISSFENIDDFEVLYVVTPTEPLLESDLDILEDWVRDGGRLTLVSDHTNLFGSSTVLNKIGDRFGFRFNFDSFIGPRVEGGVISDGVRRLHALTPNTAVGSGRLLYGGFGFSERPNYSNPSFFDDFRITGEDRFSFHGLGYSSSIGDGHVVLFTDSTLFADFAIARRSSQIILANLHGPLVPHFLYFLLPTIAAGMLSPISFPVLMAAAMIIFSSLVSIPDSLNTPSEKFEAKGGYRAISKGGEKLETALASSYLFYPRFPIWDAAPFGGPIAFEGYPSDFLVRSDDSMSSSIDQILSPPFPNLRQLEPADLTPDYLGSFWFDSGIGPPRMAKFEKLWGIPSSVVGRYVGDVQLRGLGAIAETAFSGVPLFQIDDGWVILGKGLIARFVKGRNSLIALPEWQVVPINMERLGFSVLDNPIRKE